MDTLALLQLEKPLLNAAIQLQSTKSPVIVIRGTYREAKLIAALQHLERLANGSPGDYLFRVPTLQYADGALSLTSGHAVNGLLLLLSSKRQVKVGTSTLYLDSALESSQASTPLKLAGALLWPGELFDERLDSLEKLRWRLGESGTLIIATAFDNHDETWMSGLAPDYVHIHHPDPVEHARLTGLPSHMSDDDYAHPVVFSSKGPSEQWQVELDNLTGTVNVGDGASHPDDWKMVGKVLHNIRKTCAVQPSSKEVQAYLLFRGWPAPGAGRVSSEWAGLAGETNS